MDLQLIGISQQPAGDIGIHIYLHVAGSKEKPCMKVLVLNLGVQALEKHKYYQNKTNGTYTVVVLKTWV